MKGSLECRRERVCLQDGLRLDLNRLNRNGFIKRGANIGTRRIRWTHSYWGDVANGIISADMTGKHEGWFRIQVGSLDLKQTETLKRLVVRKPRIPNSLL